MSVATASTAAPQRQSRARRLPSWFGTWELTLVVLIVAVVVTASVTSPFFATGLNFSITAAGAAALALMVIPMAWLMISGEIDLSIASIFGVSGVVFGLAVEAGAGTVASVAAALVAGGVAGLVNGVLVADLGLPSLVVTVGTLGLFRGVAYILLESRSISAIPPGVTRFAQGNLPGTIVPFSLVLFLLLALAAGVLLHRGGIGRKAYAVGSSLDVSRFSGLRVQRVKRGLFVFSGTFAALAGVVYAGYVSSARANNGTGLELSVIAIVLIGGVSMFGGRGTFPGVVLSLVLVTVLTSWMSLAYVPSNVQNTVVGLLMIGAVVVPVVVRRVQDRRARPTQ